MTGPLIVPEGQHVYMSGGVLHIVGEYSRPLTVTCACCPCELPLRLCTDTVLDDAACDAAMDAYLAGLGWKVSGDGDANGDYCPECFAEGHHRGDS
jgi:hypothetical protein